MGDCFALDDTAVYLIHEFSDMALVVFQCGEFNRNGAALPGLLYCVFGFAKPLGRHVPIGLMRQFDFLFAFGLLALVFGAEVFELLDFTVLFFDLPQAVLVLTPAGKCMSFG